MFCSLDLRLVRNCSLTVVLKHSLKFLVVRHTKAWKRRGDHQDYLGFYTLDSRHMSPSVHGLLGRTNKTQVNSFIKEKAGNQSVCFLSGQFYHGVQYEVTYQDPDEVQRNHSTTMYVKGHAINVTR